MIWNILVYAIVAVGVILLVALTVYRIDWARHPEKYKELEKSDEKSEYWAKKKRKSSKNAWTRSTTTAPSRVKSP